ncbi:hypothetical protein [Caulobacter sp. LjRoot300]|uniref:hypothetical protein n=1 Tax=Caulobacter sp. LjRoot300 TaxID=3342321 RepID=UPI003ECEEBF7
MPTYLFIDDDAGSAADAEIYADALMTARPALMITPMRPDILPKTLEAIARAKPDGLLLDVALTNALTEDKQHVGFDGIALAQQIRTLQTRGRATGSAMLGEFPIIRFSKKDVIREYVNEDPTSDDLFDEMIDKGALIDDADGAADKALSLAQDYPAIVRMTKEEASDEAIAALLNRSSAFLTRLDPRSLLGLRRTGAPAHVVARYFTSKLLARSGPLIDEALLAVRLGVDSESPDWERLKAQLNDAVYAGPFSLGYKRWWHVSVMDWWQEKIADAPPGKLSTPERVQALSAALNLTDLIPLAEDALSPGLRYWHRCSRSARPVDPSYGFALLPVYGLESWQDAEYLCQEEAMRDPSNPRLGATERSRLALLLKATER